MKQHKPKRKVRLGQPVPNSYPSAWYWYAVMRHDPEPMGGPTVNGGLIRAAGWAEQGRYRDALTAARWVLALHDDGSP